MRPIDDPGDPICVAVPVVLRRLDSGDYLAAAAGARPTLMVSPLDAALLRHCRHARSFSAHVHTFASASRPIDPPPAASDVVLRLTSLLERRLVITEIEIIAAWSHLDPVPRRAAEHQATMAVLTADRPHALRQWLASVARERGRFDGPMNVIVMDDGLTHHHVEPPDGVRDISLRLATRRTRAEYGAALAKATDVDERLVSFALCGPPGLRPSAGGNRNALLLDQAGAAYVRCDDDTECDLGTVHEKRAELLLDGDARPERDAVFLSRAEAFAQVQFGADSFLEYHHRFLGSPIGDLVSDDHWQQVRLSNSATGFFPPTAAARARFTAPGVVGDAGANSGCLRIRHAPGQGDDWWLDGPRFDALVTSREILRTTRSVTLARPRPVLGLSIGCDASSVLPPCPPVGRGQDGVFFALVRRCVLDAYVCHLPRVVRHVPPCRPPYTLASLSDDLREFRLADVVLALVESAPLTANPSAETRLAAVGSFLRQTSSSVAAFDDVWAPLVTQQRMSYMAALSNLLAEHAVRAPRWRTFAEAQLRVIESLRDSTHLRHVTDFPTLTVHESPAEGLLGHLDMFGRLLCAWPALFEAAMHGRTHGVRPTRVVHGRDEP
jgi:hypothetical protein